MSKKEIRRKIYIYAHWQEIEEPVIMGVLQSELLRGKEIFSFKYDNTWLNSEYARLLDPELQLYIPILSKIFSFM